MSNNSSQLYKKLDSSYKKLDSIRENNFNNYSSNIEKEKDISGVMKVSSNKVETPKTRKSGASNFRQSNYDNFKMSMSISNKAENENEDFLGIMNKTSAIDGIKSSFSKVSQAKDYKERILSLQDQLVLFKTHFNKKEREFHQIKIAYHKLEEENSKNLKILKKVLNNVNLHRHIKDNENDRFLIQDVETMKETYLINSLKHEVHKLKEQLLQKDLRIEELIKSEKVVKFTNLQSEYKTICDNYLQLNKNYLELQEKFETVNSNYNIIVEERDNLKISLEKYKVINNDMRNKLKFYQNEASSAHFIQEDLIEKMVFTKYSQKYLKNKLRQAETEKKNFESKLRETQDFNKERDSLQMQISNLTKKYNFALFEKDQANKKMKQASYNLDYNKNEGSINANKLSSNVINASYISKTTRKLSEINNEVEIENSENSILKKI